MDAIAGKERLLESFRKYRYVLLILLVGIFMMVLPEKEAEPVGTEPVQAAPAPDLEASLTQLLSKVSGAGQVEVLLTEQEGEQTLYQSDDVVNDTDIRRDTVLVTDGDRTQSGLVRQVNPPKYRGAVVLCQGADQPQVRLAIVEAVKCATGLSSDLITVLKMK